MENKIGVFFYGSLVEKYPANYKGSVKALKDALEATEETGLLHEVKRIEENRDGE